MNDKDKQEKFLDLIEPLLDKLYMYVRALEKNRMDAEDLASDTILICYRNFDKLKDEKLFKGYVFKVARNIYRRKKRREIFRKYHEEIANEIPSAEASPDLALDVEILYKALEQLPVKQREAVVLFEISGFSMNEIKEIQGSTLSAVKSRIKRGREKLTEILNPASQKKDLIESRNSFERKLIKA